MTCLSSAASLDFSPNLCLWISVNLNGFGFPFPKVPKKYSDMMLWKYWQSDSLERYRVLAASLKTKFISSKVHKFISSSFIYQFISSSLSPKLPVSPADHHHPVRLGVSQVARELWPVSWGIKFWVKIIKLRHATWCGPRAGAAPVWWEAGDTGKCHQGQHHLNHKSAVNSEEVWHDDTDQERWGPLSPTLWSHS